MPIPSLRRGRSLLSGRAYVKPGATVRRLKLQTGRGLVLLVLVLALALLRGGSLLLALVGGGHGLGAVDLRGGGRPHVLAGAGHHDVLGGPVTRPVDLLARDAIDDVVVLVAAVDGLGGDGVDQGVPA